MADWLELRVVDAESRCKEILRSRLGCHCAIVAAKEPYANMSPAVMKSFLCRDGSES